MMDTEKKLIQAQAELDRTCKEYEAFLYAISHDLGAPIRHINSFSQIILESQGDQFDEKTRHYFQFVIEGGKQLNEMLAALLTLSRLNTQKRPFEQTDISEIIATLQSGKLAEEFETRKASLVVEKLPIISADGDQIALLFEALLSNALKFQVEGTMPKIHISAEADDGQWRFRIEDNGIGLEPKYAESVFGIFKKANATGKYPGTGIGLTIAEKIVVRHGGTIRILPAKTQGTIVEFELNSNPPQEMGQLDN